MRLGLRRGMTTDHRRRVCGRVLWGPYMLLGRVVEAILEASSSAPQFQGHVAIRVLLHDLEGLGPWGSARRLVWNGNLDDVQLSGPWFVDDVPGRRVGSGYAVSLYLILLVRATGVRLVASATELPIFVHKQMTIM